MRQYLVNPPGGQPAAPEDPIGDGLESLRKALRDRLMLEGKQAKAPVVNPGQPSLLPEAYQGVPGSTFNPFGPR